MTKKEKPLSHGQVALLGAEKLAEILLDAVWKDEALEGRLRRELAARGPDDGLAALIRSQLHELARHDFVSWREASQLAGEIDALRQSIVENVLPSSPRLAADLLGEIASEEGAILEGVDDSGGDVGGALERIVGDWGAAWAAVDDRDPDAIANLVLEALEASDYGTRDGIVTAFGNALGGDGLQRIEDLTRSVMKSRPRRHPDRDTWDPKWSRLCRVLKDVADAKSDPDLFVEALQLDGTVEMYRAGIAERMLRAERADEALQWVEDADENDFRHGYEIARAKAAALEALGRGEEAQEVRWRRVEACLDLEMLKSFLCKLATARERERAKKRAVRIASAHEEVHQGVRFLMELSELEAAARLVSHRIAELDGSAYQLLESTADRLSGQHPAAATLLYRRMVESVLDRGRSTAYDHAARDLRRAAACARRAGRSGKVESHARFLARLRERHGRKRAFWSRVVNRSSSSG